MLRTLLALVLLSGLTSTVSAQPELIWGGDEAGGGPYIYPDEAGNRIGFEVDLANYLGQELKRTPQFQQVTWSDLPKTLENRQIQIVLNGFEFTEERNAKGNCSLPYYVYKLRLIAHRSPGGKAPYRSWEELLKPNDDGSLKTVAVLKGTLAQKFLEDRFKDKIEIKATDDVAEMLELLSDERLDATVQDSPAALFYITGGKYPQLQIIDEPVGYGLYVILTHPDDKELKQQIDTALRKAFASGKLREILQKYRLWNVDQQRLSYFYSKQDPIRDDEISDEANEGKPDVPQLSLSGLVDPLVSAAWMTLALAFLSMPLAILIGLFVAVGRLYGPWPVRSLATLYVEVLRGTPLLLQMFFWFFLLPQAFRSLGWDALHDLWTSYPFAIGVFGLALNYSASEAENYRAGLQAIPKGQLEAALALGMTRRTAIRRILLPQAIRIVIPPVTNDFIALLKDTSICSMILVTELTGLYHKYKTFPEVAPQLALTVAMIYLFLSYPLALIARWLERRQA
jgi:polar amino acid transport system substrate-binding protein